MTESLLHKLEEKMMSVLSEIETLRKEIKFLREENSVLRHDKAKHSQKLEGLVSLLDSLSAIEMPIVNQNMGVVELISERA